MPDRKDTSSGDRAAGSRLYLVVLGPALIVASPIVGLLPGPGGIFVFAAGLGLTLKHIRSSRRTYVRIKRRWPRIGRLSDMGLRRKSAAQRVRKARQRN